MFQVGQVDDHMFIIDTVEQLGLDIIALQCGAVVLRGERMIHVTKSNFVPIQV
jgi:hypothetical protein